MKQICKTCHQTKDDTYSGEWVGRDWYCDDCWNFREEKAVACKWLVVLAFIGLAVFYGYLVAGWLS